MGVVPHELLSEAAGQRCMAISVVLLVGDAYGWLPDLVNLAKKIEGGWGIREGR
jgi:malonate-semialdehyde dehydrogenase (acetylating)/methylmalonate-semialdehyde dehydrogenase